MIALNHHEQDGAEVIQVKGDIDLYSSPELRELLLKTIAASSRPVAVDLREVSYMDSSGVATLVEGLKACGSNKKELLLLASSPPVVKVLQLSRLDTVFKMVEAL